MDQLRHTNMEGLHIRMGKGGGARILFGTEHGHRCVDSFGTWKVAPIRTWCSFFLDCGCGCEAGGCEWLALNSESLCFSGSFSVGLFFFNAFNYHSSNEYIPSTSTQQPQKFGISCTCLKNGLAAAWLFSSFFFLSF